MARIRGGPERLRIKRPVSAITGPENSKPSPQGFPKHGEVPVDKEPTFSPSGIRIKESGLDQSPSSITADVGKGVGSVKRSSDGDHIKDDQKTIKLEGESPVDGSIGLKKPKSLDEERSSMDKLSDYNRKRKDFDAAYNYDAEKFIADLEFKDTDTEADRQLKLKMLSIYNQCLDEREERKKCILEKDLLFPDRLVKDLSPESRVLYERYKVFVLYHSKEDYKTMMKTVTETDENRRQLEVLQEVGDAGCHTYPDMNRYTEMKKDAEKVGKRVKHTEGGTSPTIAANLLGEWDVVGLPGSDLLSATEQRLCNEARMLPTQYLNMQEVISVKISEGSITKKSDAHSLFKVDPSNVDKVYDLLVKKGISPP